MIEKNRKPVALDTYASNWYNLCLRPGVYGIIETAVIGMREAENLRYY